MVDVAKRFFATAAWVNGGWASNVLLTVDSAGKWSGVSPDAPEEMRVGAQPLSGPVLPGIVNAHSHAFQRAIAGLTERSESPDDDFWSWRERMYSAANRVTPKQLEAIATFLYAELLQAGYTHVCEFHYLHNDIGGAAYADPMEMSLAKLVIEGKIDRQTALEKSSRPETIESLLKSGGGALVKGSRPVSVGAANL